MLKKVVIVGLSPIILVTNVVPVAIRVIHNRGKPKANDFNEL